MCGVEGLKRVLELIEAKNKYYGDSWKELGTLGLVYRIKDKCNRIINMTVNHIGDDDDIKEEIYDIAGYVILLLKNEEIRGKRW